MHRAVLLLLILLTLTGCADGYTGPPDNDFGFYTRSHGKT